MKKEFYDRDHAQNYLSNTVIRLGGNPIYIDHIDYGRGDQLVAIYYPSDKVDKDNRKIVRLDNEELDLTPVPLGFLSVINTADTMTGWCSRIPQRKWKQGLSHNSLTVISPVGYRFLHDRQRVLVSRELARTIKGQFAPLNKALELSKELQKPIAFSRRFAVDSKNLFYKNHQVTVGTIENKIPVLDEDMGFLSEALNEDLNA